MAQDFTLTTFIENRWEEAREELSRQDPTFVNALESYRNVDEMGVRLPALSEVNKATVPLSDIWHDLLEISLEIYQELWRFEFTVALMKSETSGQMLWYCFDTWTQDAYNLCEKVNVLIAHTCKVHNLGNKLKDNYRKRIKRMVQDNLGKNRQAMVHGADDPTVGGRGRRARAITQHPLGWETAVVLGTRIIPDILEYSHKSLPRTAAEYSKMIEKMGRSMLSIIGAILNDFNNEIANAKPKAI